MKNKTVDIFIAGDGKNQPKMLVEWSVNCVGGSHGRTPVSVYLWQLAGFEIRVLRNQPLAIWDFVQLWEKATPWIGVIE